MGEADPHSRTIAAESLGDIGSPSAPGAPSADGRTSGAVPTLLASRYELLGMLGAGAMGTVYRARDRELDEVVALKILKKELASAEMIERFRREVKLARRVTHQNVARTYDIGEHGGDRFLTMEFVEGEMLAGVLGRKGKLPVAEVVRIALDVCAGLGAAHAANVLHRDLKPENVILARDGRAVITDFGIARAAAASGGSDLAGTIGGMVGTPAYMAPEQVEGASDLDARADLYALGTMLFELLSGAMAWQGDTIVTIAAGRLLRPPPDVRAIDPSVPAPIAELVLKLMARNREDRFPSAARAAAALEALPLTEASEVRRAPSSGTLLTPETAAKQALLGGRARVPGSKTVAVLPVLNLSAHDDAYLVHSLNEDVIDLLSVVPGVLVRPRGDTARFEDPSRDVRAIGTSLGVDVVVDASLRRIGESIRVAFRLIAAVDGFQLWARRFDRAPTQVLSIADDAAHAIAQALTSELKVQPQVRATDAATEEMYLRGRYLLRRGWHASAKEAADLLLRASERAPDAPRIVGAYALAMARSFGMERRGREVEEQARALATRALDLDPAQPEARCALATLHLTCGETEASARCFRAALAAAPNCVEAIDWLGRFMTEVGLVEQGLAMLERATAIDPDCGGARQQLARIRGIFQGPEALRATLGQMPSDPNDLATWILAQGRDALWRRDVAAARSLADLVESAPLPDTARFAIRSLLEVALGNGERMKKPEHVAMMLPVDASRPPRRAAFNGQLRCELFMSVGDHAQAIEGLKAADSNGFFDVVFLDACPLLEPIRSDPEFLGVVGRVRERAKRLITVLA
jgi:serine/threonine-protein kinase